jgi:hypothetical protein
MWEMSMAERALIYIPDDGDAEKWLTLCLGYVARHDYELVAVVRGDWAGVRRMLDDGQAVVVVIARRDHPPAGRVPREVYVEEEGPAPTPQQRRPRLIPRDGADGP